MSHCGSDSGPSVSFGEGSRGGTPRTLELPLAPEHVGENLLFLVENTVGEQRLVVDRILEAEVVEHIAQEVSPRVGVEFTEDRDCCPAFVPLGRLGEILIIDLEQGAFLKVRQDDPPAPAQVVNGLVGEVVRKGLLVFRHHERGNRSRGVGEGGGVQVDRLEDRRTDLGVVEAVGIGLNCPWRWRSAR